MEDSLKLLMDQVDHAIENGAGSVTHQAGWLRIKLEEIHGERLRTAEKLQSTVDQSEHFQRELHETQIGLSVAIMDRIHALAECKRQEDVIKGTSVVALFELLDIVKPVQLGPGKVTFRKSDWQRIVTAIHAIRP